MASLLYTLNFDLASPPFEMVQEVSVMDFESAIDQMKIKTSKNGFRFKSDDGDIF